MNDIRFEVIEFVTTTIYSKNCNCNFENFDNCKGCDNSETVIDYKVKPYLNPVRKIDYNTGKERA